jgi:hypothetical protein
VPSLVPAVETRSRFGIRKINPNFETIAALHKVMLAAGVAPPPLTPHAGVNNSAFGPRERKYAE